MSYATFCGWAFAIFLGGCFTAMMLSLRSSAGNRVLPQTYGLWIAAAYFVHHMLIPSAAQHWHHYWYLWNAMIAAFPIALAGMLKDADARIPVMWLGFGAVTLCLVYAFFSGLGHPLPGILYFYGSNAFEGAQVVSMIVWSGPVIPAVQRIRKTIRQWRDRTWDQRAAV